MRFEQLILRRYGHFTDFALDFHQRKVGEPDLHVLYGANEAGKSTTLAAITDLLYGFKKQTTWNFLHDNSLLEIEALLEQGGYRHGVKRFKTRITDQSNNRLERLPLDLQGITRDDFGRRFSFDEQALQDGGDQILNSGGDVGQALYSASAGLANLKERLDRATLSADTFWQPRKTANLELTSLKAQLKNNLEQLNATRLDSTTWRKLKQALELAEEQRKNHTEQRDRLALSLKKLEARKSSIGLALQYQSLATTIEHLEKEGVVPIAISTDLDLDDEISTNRTVEFVREKIETRRIMDARLKQQKQSLEALRLQLERATPDARAEILLAAQTRIDQLAEDTSADYAWRQQLTDSRSELQRHQEQTKAMSLRLNIDDSAIMDLALPGANQLEQLKTLLEEEALLSGQLAHAEKELKDLASSRDALKEPPTIPDKMVDPSIARDVLTRIQNDGLIQQRQQAQTRQKECRQLLIEKCRLLNLSEDNIELLAVPDERWLSAQLEKLTAIHQKISQCQASANSLQASVADNNRKCDELITTGAVDPLQISSTFEQRENLWQTHIDSIKNNASSEELELTAYRFSSKLAEHDLLMKNAIASHAESAELAVLQGQNHRATHDLQQLYIEQSKLEQETLSVTDAIRSRISSFYGATEFDIEAIRAIFPIASQALAAHAALLSAAAAAEDVNQACKELAGKLVGVLEAFDSGDNLDSLNKLDLADLIPRADKAISLHVESIRKMQQAQDALQHYEQETSRRTRDKESIEYEIEQWQAQWSRASRGSLFSDMNPAQARDALPTITQLATLLESQLIATQKIDELNARTATRDQSIQQLLLELDVGELGEAVIALREAVDQTTTHARLQEQIEQLELDLQNSTAELNAEMESLETIKSTMTVDSDSELLQLLTRTARHRAAQQRCQELIENISEVVGTAVDASSINSILKEEEDDKLAVELLALSSQLQEAESAYALSHEQWALARQALDSIDDGPRYAQLTQERTTLLLQIEELARHTAKARTGRIILNTAIAKFRHEHQSVLLAEAREAFTTLTAGRYINLVPGENKKGEDQLYAIEASGSGRAVHQLSTGTRYQLYLALRAAAHADYARQRVPLPFVADDIMESFDDQRSAAAFEVLGRMAENGQVLYLTHHKHLLGIAQEVLGKDVVQIHHYG